MNEKAGKILIVDDYESNALVLGVILDNDYEIHIASSGKEALEKAKALSPDVILLDILMPDMDGFEVIKKLKRSDETKHIPVIFTTGVDDIDYEVKGLSLGAADFLNKPYHPELVKLRVGLQMRIIKLNRDKLTSLPNRQVFDERLDEEWSRAIRAKTETSILLLDIDRFKRFNDKYGHNNGDVALKTISQTAKSILKRPTDLIARWGGEEFAVLLPMTDSEGALYIAEEIRQAIEKTPILLETFPETRATVSIGVHTHIPTLKCSPIEFFEKADKALYKAKNNGRNRVEVHDPVPACSIRRELSLCSVDEKPNSEISADIIKAPL